MATVLRDTALQTPPIACPRRATCSISARIELPDRAEGALKSRRFLFHAEGYDAGGE